MLIQADMSGDQGGGSNVSDDQGYGSLSHNTTRNEEEDSLHSSRGQSLTWFVYTGQIAFLGETIVHGMHKHKRG